MPSTRAAIANPLFGLGVPPTGESGDAGGVGGAGGGVLPGGGGVLPGGAGGGGGGVLPGGAGGGGGGVLPGGGGGKSVMCSPINFDRRTCADFGTIVVSQD